MAWETGIQFPVESYLRLKKWYLIPFCITPSIIRYGSRVSVVAIEKGAFGLPLTIVGQHIYKIKLGFFLPCWSIEIVSCMIRIFIFNVLIVSCLWFAFTAKMFTKLVDDLVTYHDCITILFAELNFYLFVWLFTADF